LWFFNGSTPNTYGDQRHLFSHNRRGYRGPPDPGTRLIGSAYEQSLAHEFSLRQIPFERQKSLPLDYKGIRLDCGYRLDFLVADLVVVEIKTLDVLLPIHQAQLLTYLKLGGWKLGLLINFHAHYCAKALSASSSGLRRSRSRQRPLPKTEIESLRVSAVSSPFWLRLCRAVSLR
jgi:GxxExxY protein